MPKTPTSDEANTRSQILAVAAGLFMSRGYNKTSVQAIIDDVGVAKGTFYHHFKSKHALLDAWVQQSIAATQHLIDAVMNDPALGPVDKLRRMASQGNAWKLEHKAELLAMSRALTSPDNLLLYTKMMQQGMASHVPFMAKIIRQGTEEGVFDVDNAALTAQLVMVVARNVSESLNRLVLSDPHPPDAMAQATALIDAQHDAINRLLGAAPGTVQLVEPDAMRGWFE
ncbi:MAG: TetR/AcrR family transcriptional regulator [Myxococcota bacterium]